MSAPTKAPEPAPAEAPKAVDAVPPAEVLHELPQNPNCVRGGLLRGGPLRGSEEKE